MPPMASGLVGARVVCGPAVLRDWALHFRPDDGTLLAFFTDIASGSNDSGDGFVLQPRYDASKMQARVAEQKDGQEMTIPSSAKFEDAASFGRWFTFQVPDTGAPSASSSAPAPAPAPALASRAVSEQQQSIPARPNVRHQVSESWNETIARKEAKVAPSVRSVRAMAVPSITPITQKQVRGGHDSTTARHADEGECNGKPSGSIVPPLNVRAVQHRTPLGDVYKGNLDSEEVQDSTMDESVSSSESDLDCNTHETTNLDKEEEESEGSPAVDSNQDALSCVHESFMQLMQKLLRAMPSSPQSARLLQCANPPYTPSSRAKRCEGNHDVMDGPCQGCSMEDIGCWTYNISQLVFDYITTVMFDEGILLEVDYTSWEDVLLVVEHNPTACKVALAKLGEHPQTAGKCLLADVNGPCKDFAYVFCKGVIRHSHITHRLVLEDVEASPVFKLGTGLLDVFQRGEWTVDSDLVPLFDVVCSCVLVTLQLGYKPLWTRAVRVLSKVSSDLAKTVWGGHAVQMLKLETVNKIFARLVREGVAGEGPSSGAPYEISMEMREEFAQHPHLAKGFVHPLMLVKDEFVEFLQAYIWDCDNATFQVLEAMEDLLSDEASLAGHDTVLVSKSICRIAGIEDKFQTHRMVYWLFRPEQTKAGIWHMAFGRFGRQHRWRLLYLLMQLSKYGEETTEHFRKRPNWTRLLGWMVKDGAVEGGKVSGEPGIDKREVYKWAQEYGNPPESSIDTTRRSAGSSMQPSASYRRVSGSMERS
ncbi:hypothetical protein BSKO_06909 [Bryopsis sp. KO-2023]|nr:hypothetical protein BSKO_06909 [Bryopsis sp. KO-2023]